ncbi:MAG: transglycosylase domain-containing protein, partial [Deltaproteobacteria bacterium]|nr:transglycosylase domain-containing protein [Deltaproteobacteria bacterium]
RWIEGIEASRLEKSVTKADILEFYLNQVPFASNRRGIVQAASFYFDRDLETLSKKEMIALAALVRAPSRLDLRKNPLRLSPVIKRLTEKLSFYGMISKEEHEKILKEKFQLAIPKCPVFASHFVQFIFNEIPENHIHSNRKILTTLDGYIQNSTQEILDQALKDLEKLRVYNGAALVVDNKSNEILAWSVAGRGDSNIPGSAINAVISPRQPGSSMKPFLYALALERGWTAATIIRDAPLVDSVGKGLHEYHNFSRLFYGPVTLRQALGNSLNIPAVRTIKYIGVGTYLETLRKLGMESLYKHPDFYGDGLALGNGEVSLFELVQAYTVFARHGEFVPLSYINNPWRNRIKIRVYSEETASLIGNILSDPEARALEFGYGGLLNFPVQTAVKTGTSSDYRDAWAVGFDYNFTVGVWMGNLDGSETNGLTGSRGPAIVLRSIFSELNKNKATRPLYLSPKLVKRGIYENDVDSENCVKRSEWFISGTIPKKNVSADKKGDIKLVQPKNGLHLAMDPRIPDDYEVFEFSIDGIESNVVVEWKLNNSERFKTSGGRYLWPLRRGVHSLKAVVWEEGQKLYETKEVAFSVK